jgi:hypothetical protein
MRCECDSSRRWYCSPSGSALHGRSERLARRGLRRKPEFSNNKFAAWNATKATWAFLLWPLWREHWKKTWIGCLRHAHAARAHGRALAQKCEANQGVSGRTQVSRKERHSARPRPVGADRFSECYRCYRSTVSDLAYAWQLAGQKKWSLNEAHRFELLVCGGVSKARKHLAGFMANSGGEVEPGLIRAGVGRKVNCESRSKSNAALDRNLSAMRFRRSAHESETEAPTNLALRLGVLRPRE